MYQPSLTTNTVPLYATASGKAWLATRDADKVEEIIRKNGSFEEAGRYGPNVVQSMDALAHEIEATAARGYGIAISEAEPGVTAVAAVIRSGGGEPVVGTVSVAGPTLRMTEQRVRELAPSVLAAAAELSDVWPLRVRIRPKTPKPHKAA